MNSSEDWIVVEGMHEAIVSKEEFEKAQAVIHKAADCPVRKGRDYPFKGLIRCGNCGRVMQRIEKYFLSADTVPYMDVGLSCTVMSVVIDEKI